MIKYTITPVHRTGHRVRFEAVFPIENGAITLRLPKWRPGRYEIGNFAKYLFSIRFRDGQLQVAPEVIDNHTWKLTGLEEKQLHVSYEFYAGVLDAGSCWLDEEQLYLNPVHCMLYDESRPDLNYTLRLELPENYEIAGALRQTKKHQLEASGYQGLMDSPFFCSDRLQHWSYDVADITFHLWFIGEHELDKEKVLTDFEKFTVAQINAFGGFPVDEYHFLFQFPRVKTYHGVEHEKSTVIALGPGMEMHTAKYYEHFLGISSHELYHTWNIKSIRPVDMMPYDFSKPNYSKLGYVAEGVTTYLGDEFLYRSGVFTKDQWLKCLEQWLMRHYWNTGRFNKSVADSSIETWLDGYEAGVPGRKVSIYTEGALIAFICDMRIRMSTGSKRSIDDVMKKLWEDFGQKGKGYTEEDYWQIMESVGGIAFDDIREELVENPGDFTPYLQKAFDSSGIRWEQRDAKPWETKLGMRLHKNGNKILVLDVHPSSPAETLGFWRGDQILQWNQADPDQLLNNEIEENVENIEIQWIKHGKELKASTPKVLHERFYTKHKLNFHS